MSPGAGAIIASMEEKVKSGRVAEVAEIVEYRNRRKNRPLRALNQVRLADDV